MFFLIENLKDNIAGFQKDQQIHLFELLWPEADLWFLQLCQMVNFYD